MDHSTAELLRMALQIQTTADLIDLANIDFTFFTQLEHWNPMYKFKAAIRDIINEVETNINNYEPILISGWPCQQEANHPLPPPSPDVSQTASQGQEANQLPPPSPAVSKTFYRDQEANKLPPLPTDVSLTVSQDREANRLPPASPPIISQSCGEKYNGNNSRRGHDGQRRRRGRRRSPAYSYIRSHSLPDADLKKRRPFNKNIRNSFRSYSSNWRGKYKKKKKFKLIKPKLPGSICKMNIFVLFLVNMVGNPLVANRCVTIYSSLID